MLCENADLWFLHVLEVNPDVTLAVLIPVEQALGEGLRVMRSEYPPVGSVFFIWCPVPRHSTDDVFVRSDDVVIILKARLILNVSHQLHHVIVCKLYGIVLTNVAQLLVLNLEDSQMCFVGEQNFSLESDFLFIEDLDPAELELVALLRFWNIVVPTHILQCWFWTNKFKHLDDTSELHCIIDLDVKQVINECLISIYCSTTTDK